MHILYVYNVHYICVHIYMYTIWRACSLLFCTCLLPACMYLGDGSEQNEPQTHPLYRLHSNPSIHWLHCIYLVIPPLMNIQDVSCYV